MHFPLVYLCKQQKVGTFYALRSNEDKRKSSLLLQYFNNS